MRTAQSIEESKAQRTDGVSAPTPKRKMHPNSLANLVAPWKPGHSGNPLGAQKHDTSRDIAQAVFEQNQEGIYKALTQSLLKGNPYAFKELSVRAYGNVPEKLEVSGMEGLADRLAKRRK